MLYILINKIFTLNYVSYNFKKFNKILCLSKSSKLQLESINPDLIHKTHIYRYWVDTNYFKNNSKLNSLKILRLLLSEGLLKKVFIYF